MPVNTKKMVGLKDEILSKIDEKFKLDILTGLKEQLKIAEALTLSLPASGRAGANTDLPSKSNIWKTERVNITLII